jgi:hypothetical protein
MRQGGAHGQLAAFAIHVFHETRGGVEKEKLRDKLHALASNPGAYAAERDVASRHAQKRQKRGGTRLLAAARKCR